MILIKREIIKFLQERINRKNRDRFKKICNRKVSIIANNCIGGYIYHYLNLRFGSPTINLFILPSDYIKMLENFDKYFDPNATISEVQSDKPYPVGEIYDCRIYFMHYNSFNEAVSKWRERCLRLDKKSLYIMMTDRDGCTIEDIKAFDALDYKNKVIFTCCEYKDISSSYYIRGFEKQNSVGHLHESMNITGKRYIDQFDYVEFLAKD